MDGRQLYLNLVFPRVPEAVRQQVLQAYPHISLKPDKDFLPLAECDITMLVGMTGSGKSTTLRELREAEGIEFEELMPTRRQLADLILIPTAQHLINEPIVSIKDRTQRFAYTRHFRDVLVPGGTAEAFTWLYCDQPDTHIISEGVRGENEIRYVLEHTRWRIAELWVNPVLRLQRLSQRRDTFDQVHNPDAEDLSFLPPEFVETVKGHIAAGEITPEAIATVREETISYGHAPFDVDNTTANYRCFVIDDLSPQQVAAAVVEWIRETKSK